MGGCIVSSIAWERACVVLGAGGLGGLFADKPTSWPARLAPAHLARLQCAPVQRPVAYSGDDPIKRKLYRLAAMDWSECHAIQRAIEAACAAGVLPHEVAAFTFGSAAFGINEGDSRATIAAKWRDQCSTRDLPAISAGDFVQWLAAQAERPAPLVEAWQRATASQTPCAPLKAVPRAQAHEAAILDALRRSGFDPERLPSAPAGKVSPGKQAARDALPSMTPAVFGKAWERLRASGAVSDARHSDELGEGGGLKVGG